MYKLNMEAELMCLECPYPDCVNKGTVRADCQFIRERLKRKAPLLEEGNGADTGDKTKDRFIR